MGDSNVSTAARTDEGSGGRKGLKSSSGPCRLEKDDHGKLVNQLLVKIVEGEIIPRLMVAHKVDEQAYRDLGAASRAPSDAEVAEFTRLALAQDQTVMESYVEAIREAGCGLDDVLLNLLAPTARRLGEMWENDECSFVDVTLSLSRLHSLMHHLSRQHPANPRKPANGRRALLATAPGEQHVFGLLIVEDFMQRAGWEVHGGVITQSAAELIQRVREEHFTFVGLTLSSDRLYEDLKTTIAAMRQASANPDAAFFVGGQTFINNPDLVSDVGADGLAYDANEAVTLAERLLKESAPME